MLNDGRAFVDNVKSEGRGRVIVDIHIGKNRIVRRIFEHLGYKVLGLDRIIYAGLTKIGLPIGSWRLLKPEEVKKLFLK